MILSSSPSYHYKDINSIETNFFKNTQTSNCLFYK